MTAFNAAMASTSPQSPARVTKWEHVAETTSWGRYLNDIEKRVILQAEGIAAKDGKPGNGVDMGCGGGRWSKLLADRGWSMTCADVDGPSLAICQQKLPTAKCVLARPTDQSIPVADNSVEMLLCIEVIPLIEAAWFPAEARRALRDDGLMVGVYINGRSLRALAWRLRDRLTQSARGSTFYSASYSDWKRQFVKTGFEMVHEESCCWGPFTRSSNSPLVPACAKLERALGLHRILAFSPWVIFIARKKARPGA